MEVAGAYDWEEEVKKFEETKAGVKGLVDSGITEIPKFFIHPPERRSSNTKANGSQLQVPIIDLQGINGGRRAEIVDEIRRASETWGYFQMVNHGVPEDVMEALLEATRRVHEQLPVEDKVALYSADGRQKVRFYTINGNFRQFDTASWRDSFACNFTDDSLDPEAIPSICRKEVGDYVKCLATLRETLAELISEALGLSSDYLAKIKCMKSQYLTCLYYPACPEPHLAFGTGQHSDSTFLTLLVQDSLGGLQVLHQNQWVDVPPVRGALVANIGDLMQLITNDKFKSTTHRVLARPTGTRVSAACFFYASAKNTFKPFGPIKELTSDESPPIYRQVLPLEYAGYYQSNVRSGTSALPHFKL